MTDYHVPPRWKPVPSCPGYSASMHGYVYSAFSGKMVFGSLDRYGYRNVNIMVGGKRVKRKMHRLVCEAWHGPCPEAHECGHLDGDKANNHESNLAWITRLENAKHQFLHGKRSRPQKADKTPERSKRPGAKLNWAQVQLVRQRGAEGGSCRTIAREFGVSKAAINRILRGLTWTPTAGDAQSSQDSTP